MDTQTIWFIVAGALIVIGLLGTILPVLPGLPVMFAGMWLAAWADGYQRIGAGVLVVLGILVALSIVTDLLASLLGARRAGASNKGLWGAGIGGFLGIFFGLPGLLAGPLLGATAGEMAHGRAWRDASRIGVGTWIGLLVGAILKVVLALAMLVLFAGALLVG
ncbi:DUF456 domain-containing protein [Arenimonas donghaensis]|uniref:DUF456 domain-containing protein n=1 Tax=Arenimonas donghaensis DSM 18148 = HO3-R19 TaxID=1121014 RepID=A0A087MLN1_9GAMM|nr:DUF456 domain-containing protein [Arenimonas donghaensis]KFL37784.1 hypothetical protein N788_01030 [Arenimonas donghaensis DSM 18148 = HO3-R19]